MASLRHFVASGLCQVAPAILAIIGPTWSCTPRTWPRR
jgi:hypothetical protein